MEFACGRCWDRNCNCTKEELEEYERQNKEKALERRMKEAYQILERYKDYITDKHYCSTVSLKEFMDRELYLKENN